MSGRRAAGLAAAAVLLLALAGAVAALSHSTPRLASADGVKLLGYPVHISGGHTVCQTGETVTTDTRTLAFGVQTVGAAGPPLQVRIGSRTVAVPGGYRTGERQVRVPAGATGTPRVCIHNAGRSPIAVAGQSAAIAIPPGIGLTVDGAPQSFAMRMRWLTAPRSGWDAIGPALRRWGYASALGAATPYAAIVLFLLAFGGALALAVRGRASAVAVGAVAFAAAAGWSLTTPAFHVPDEPQHFAYLQRLAESGHVPTRDPGPVFSDEEGAAFAGVHFNQVVGNPDAGRPPWTAAASRALIARLDADPGRFTPGGQTNATNNPPLYYVASLGPYWAATALGGNFLDRLLAVRLGSALLVALAAAFAFAFVRELLPAHPWAWAVGALAFAVAPLLGFIGGGVNNDAGLFAAGAAVFWLVARALRRGLDTRGAVGIGLAFGLGLITKATILGLAPGLALCALVLVLRSGDRGAVLRRIALAAAIAAIPVVVYAIVNSQVWDRGLWSSGAGAVPPGQAPGTAAANGPQLREFVSYLWQFYLPKLPFMHDLQAGIPAYNVWFKGLVGRYGWLDTMFASPVYTAALVVAVAIVVLAALGVWRVRDRLAGRGADALVLGGMVAGFLVVVAWAGYHGRLDNGQIFEQARYLLPLGAVYAAVIALAARGAGRFGRGAGGALVALACAHAAFSVALVVGRFYV